MNILDECNKIKKMLWDLQQRIDVLHDVIDEIADRELVAMEKRTAGEPLQNPAVKQINHELTRILQEILQ